MIEVTYIENDKVVKRNFVNGCEFKIDPIGSSSSALQIFDDKGFILAIYNFTNVIAVVFYGKGIK